MFGLEDDKQDTVVPRLVAAGADLTRIRLMKMKSGKLFSLSQHLEQFENHITKNTRLAIIDPVSSFMGPGVDVFRGNEVRGVLSPVISLGEKYGLLILLVHHFNKGKGQTAMHRISDSMAFGAICRHIYGCEFESEDKDRILFAKVRNSVAPQGRGLGMGYVLEGVNLGKGLAASRVAWDNDPVNTTIDEAMQNQQKFGKLASPEVRSEATDFLKSELERGPVARQALVEKAELRNISLRTLYRAADLLNINKINGPEGVLWSLPTP